MVTHVQRPPDRAEETGDLVVLLLVLLMFWWCLDYPCLPLVSDQGRGLLSTGGLLAGWRSEARARHPALSLPPTPAPVVPGTQLTQNWAPTIKISQLWIYLLLFNYWNAAVIFSYPCLRYLLLVIVDDARCRQDIWDLLFVRNVADPSLGTASVSGQCLMFQTSDHPGNIQTIEGTSEQARNRNKQRPQTHSELSMTSKLSTQPPWAQFRDYLFILYSYIYWPIHIGN